MMKLDDAAVLMRAKAIAAEDGFTWQLDFDAHGARLRGLHFLSEDRRRQYLARARDEFPNAPKLEKGKCGTDQRDDSYRAGPKSGSIDGVACSKQELKQVVDGFAHQI
jgi:hypothetical protein